MRRRKTVHIAAVVWLAAPGLGCGEEPPPRQTDAEKPKAAVVEDASLQKEPPPGKSLVRRPRDYRVVHVFVALCDNKHQGIVPVPAALGNGQDPANNLYWGAMYGVKTYFGKHREWRSVKSLSQGPASRPAGSRSHSGSGIGSKLVPGRRRREILDRVAYRRRDAYVVAEAYDGAHMKAALEDFFRAAAGAGATEFTVQDKSGSKTLQAGGVADLVCFVGHNGLMEVHLDGLPERGQGVRPKGAVLLACKSKPYFVPVLRKLGCPALITTTGFMAPEAYTLEAIVRAWCDGKDRDAIHLAAAKAYAKYQRGCSLSAAKRLFAVGASKLGS